jgi:hypothetical protein
MYVLFSANVSLPKSAVLEEGCLHSNRFARRIENEAAARGLEAYLRTGGGGTPRMREGR